MRAIVFPFANRRVTLLPGMPDWSFHQTNQAMQALGSVLGIAGACWMAFQLSGYRFAYLPYLLSSLLLSAYFFRQRQWWVLVQQAVFALINLAGFYRWVLSS